MQKELLKLEYSNRFLKQLAKCLKRGCDEKALIYVVNKLRRREPLETKYCDHRLKGNRKDFRECHITPDWLLIYRIHDDKLMLYLSETGTHSDLF